MKKKSVEEIFELSERPDFIDIWHKNFVLTDEENIINELKNDKIRSQKQIWSEKHFNHFVLLRLLLREKFKEIKLCEDFCGERISDGYGEDEVILESNCPLTRLLTCPKLFEIQKLHEGNDEGKCIYYEKCSCQKYPKEMAEGLNCRKCKYYKGALK